MPKGGWVFCCQPACQPAFLPAFLRALSPCGPEFHLWSWLRLSLSILPAFLGILGLSGASEACVQSVLRWNFSLCRWIFRLWAFLAFRGLPWASFLLIVGPPLVLFFGQTAGTGLQSTQNFWTWFCPPVCFCCVCGLLWGVVGCYFFACVRCQLARG